MSTSRTRAAAGAGVLAAAALVLAACTPGSNTGGEPTSGPEGDTPAGSEVSTDISDAEEQTLVVWDQEVRGGQNEQMERLNQAFMDEYPNIKIERNTQSNDDLTTTLPLALSGEDAPDVTQANNSRGLMGKFVAADQLIPLDDYADAYGWTDRFSDSVLQNTRYSDDGATFGEGSLWGLPQVGEIVGVYYNKAKLAELGLEVPTTWGAFEDQLQQIKDAGEVPLMLGNLDQWPAIHVFGPVQGAYVEPDVIRTLGFGNEGASWETPENVEAATVVQDWATSGYFNDGFNGADYDATWQSFGDGEGVYLIAGSWLAADLDAAMGDDVGFFAPPPVEEGGPLVTTGATGIPFAITAKADNPDVAAAYLDFITNADAMDVLAETGNMPVVDTAEHAPDSGVNADIFTTYSDVTEDGHLLPYLDWATPTMGTTLGQALQGLLGEQMTPEEFTATVEADYAEFVASK